MLSVRCGPEFAKNKTGSVEGGPHRSGRDQQIPAIRHSPSVTRPAVIPIRAAARSPVLRFDVDTRPVYYCRMTTQHKPPQGARGRFATTGAKRISQGFLKNANDNKILGAMFTVEMRGRIEQHRAELQKNSGPWRNTSLSEAFRDLLEIAFRCLDEQHVSPRRRTKKPAGAGSDWRKILDS